jgi:hypothetical protein
MKKDKERLEKISEDKERKDKEQGSRSEENWKGTIENKTKRLNFIVTTI